MAETNGSEPTTGTEKLCVLVPCLNEQGLVRRTVEEVLEHADRIAIRVEVVMIDDGSTDGTREVMQELCEEDSRCRLIAHDVNRGLGRCVTEAYETIDDDTWVTVFPGDSEFVFVESIDNLLAAGMLITSDHRAHMSTRNTVCSMGQGQAAGTAAALCAAEQCGVRDLSYTKLRDALVAADVYLEDA